MASWYITQEPLGHCGQTLPKGTLLELPEQTGRELRGKVLPCSPTGESWAHLAPDELDAAQQAARIKMESALKQTPDKETKRR